MKPSLLILLVATISLPATAQVVVQAGAVQLQPQIGRDSKGYSECGVRAVVADLKPETVEAYDFSIVLRTELFAGMIKAGKYQTSYAEFVKRKEVSKAVMPAPVSFWIAKESEGKALRPMKVIPADTPGFILAGTDLVQAWSTVLAIVHGERMQFATRYKKQPYDTVVSFSGKMPEEQVKPLMACLDGLVERMRSEAQAEAASTVK